MGAIARYAVSLLMARVPSGDFPLGTFVANIGGCFVLGFLASLFAGRLNMEPNIRLMLTTGIIGSFTTFSTFEYETQRLVETGAWALAAFNAAASLLAGFAAVQIGVALAR